MLPENQALSSFFILLNKNIFFSTRAEVGERGHCVHLPPARHPSGGPCRGHRTPVALWAGLMSHSPRGLNGDPGRPRRADTGCFLAPAVRLHSYAQHPSGKEIYRSPVTVHPRSRGCLSHPHTGSQSSHTPPGAPPLSEAPLISASPLRNA